LTILNVGVAVVIAGNFLPCVARPQFRPDLDAFRDVSFTTFPTTANEQHRILPMMATRAESSTAATGKAKAAQDSAASAGYELPW
jgi:hypothetical protein